MTSLRVNLQRNLNACTIIDSVCCKSTDAVESDLFKLLLLLFLRPISDKKKGSVVNLRPISDKKKGSVVNLRPISDKEKGSVVNLRPISDKKKGSVVNLRPISDEKKVSVVNLPSTTYRNPDLIKFTRVIISEYLC